MRVQTIFLVLALWGIGGAAMAQATGTVVPVPAQDPALEAAVRGPVKVESLETKRMRVKCSAPANRLLPGCAVFRPVLGGK
jgi:hypothetical protein